MQVYIEKYISDRNSFHILIKNVLSFHMFSSALYIKFISVSFKTICIAN